MVFKTFVVWLVYKTVYLGKPKYTKPDAGKEQVQPCQDNSSVK